MLAPKLSSKQEAEKLLQSKNILFGSTKMTSKKPHGTAGSVVPINTNLHLLDVQEKVEVYRYTVEVYGIFKKTNGEEAQFDYTERGQSDFVHVDRRAICRDVLKLFVRRNEERFKQTQNLVYYDLSRTLFSLNDLAITNSGLMDRFKKEDVNQLHMRTANLKDYVLIIKPATDAKARLTIGDFSFLSDDAGNIDRSLEQFLDIATSQNIFNNSQDFITYSASLSYMLCPGKFGFTDVDCPGFSSNGSFLGIGCNKTARMIEHGKEGNSAALVVSVAKTPFHSVDLVLDKVQKMVPGVDLTALHNGTKDRINKVLQGLYVNTTYPADDVEKQQRFAIYGLSDSTAQTESFLMSDQMTSYTVQEYYQRIYNITLKHPNVPLVIRREKDKSMYYPMELIWVCDNQRVKATQQTPMQIQEMIHKCAIAPYQQIMENERVKKALNLDNSEHLARARVKFRDEPMQVNARILQAPELQFANGTERPKPDTAVWSGRNAYLIPAECKRWCAYAMPDNKNRIKLSEWENFVKLFHTKMSQKGMRFPLPHPVAILPASPHKLQELFEQINREGHEFVLIAHPEGTDGAPFHHTMKFEEQRTEVVSQGLQIPTVLKVMTKNQMVTLEGIINKTNMKMGGLNYSLPLSNQDYRAILHDTLIIGFSMNHPAGGLGLFDDATNNNSNGHEKSGNGGGNSGGNGVEVTAVTASSSEHSPQKHKSKQARTVPSVVGYSANIGEKHMFEFVGGYHYQEARRDEKIDIVGHIVMHCIEKYSKRENKFPARIVMYRNACGEGSFQHILEYEVPYIKHLMAEKGCQSNLTLIVVNKIQAIRFYQSCIDKNAKAADQNIKPGTVIDQNVVHPKWTEFFLCSHRAIQGTTRVPRYNVLRDENNMTLDQLESMTNKLCFGHQIVNSPTSLPSPVYIAEEYAKRGRNVYNMAVSRGEMINDLEEASKYFGYENKDYLGSLRVNA